LSVAEDILKAVAISKSFGLPLILFFMCCLTLSTRSAGLTCFSSDSHFSTATYVNEEIEHKGLAFGLYMKAVGDRKLLRRAQRIATVLFSARVAKYMTLLMWWFRIRPQGFCAAFKCDLSDELMRIIVAR